MTVKYTLNAVNEAQNHSQSLFRYLSPELILPNPKQPRRSIEPEALHTLKESIRERGILQPLLVMRGENGKYLLVAGQRRLAAARELQLLRVPVMVLNEARPDYLVDSLLENIQREELSGIDEGHSFITLKEEFGWSQREIAARIHKHESYVSERIRTAERLTAVTKEIIAEAFARDENLARAKFSHSINRKLALLPAEQQEDLARIVATSSTITARQVETLVRNQMHAARVKLNDNSLFETGFLTEKKAAHPLDSTRVTPKKKQPGNPKSKPIQGHQLTLTGMISEENQATLLSPRENTFSTGESDLPAENNLHSNTNLLLECDLTRISPAYSRTLRLISRSIASGENLKLHQLIEAIAGDYQKNC